MISRKRRCVLHVSHSHKVSHASAVVTDGLQVLRNIAAWPPAREESILPRPRLCLPLPIPFFVGMASGDNDTAELCEVFDCGGARGEGMCAMRCREERVGCEIVNHCVVKVPTTGPEKVVICRRSHRDSDAQKVLCS